MTVTQIKQWRTAFDGLDKLRQTTAEMPQPSDGEVLVKILTVSLNYRDTEVCMGLYNHHKSVDSPEDLVPCSDACGIVVNPGSSDWKEGQRVMSIFNQTHLNGQVKQKDMASGLGLPLPGVLSEYRCFDASALVAVPDYLSNEEAATLPIAAVTAWMSINQFRPLNSPADGDVDETVVFQGTGGVAISGLQIAHAAGLKTIITSSSDQKLDKAKKLGADHGINYKASPEWQEEVMKITEGEGADIILETGGAQTLRKSFDCASFGGLISCIGYLSGKEDAPGLNTNLLALRRNLTLKGILNGPKDRFEEMCKFYAKHQIHPAIDRIFNFDEAKDALQYLYSGGHFGKVVIKVA